MIMGSVIESGWNYLLDRYTPSQLSVFGSLIITIGVYWLFGLIHLPLDIYHNPKILYAFKIQKSARSQFQGPNLKKLLINLLTNQFLFCFPFALVLHHIPSQFQNPIVGVVVERELPDAFTVFKHIMFFLVLEEVLFYHFHWLFHSKRLYGAFHKVHHEFHSPIALCANYAHPLEVMLCNFFPLFVGPMILHSHLLTFWLWNVMAILGTMIHHCGYRFPWTLPFDQQPCFHDFHHEKFEGNYGLLGILDRLYGTDQMWRKEHQKRQSIRSN